MITQPSASSWSGFSALGKVLQGFGAFESGQEQKNAAFYNAALATRNAQIIRQGAELTEYQQKKNLESMVGRQQAQYAASGVAVGVGSPVDTMVDTLSKGYLDISIARYNNAIAARGLESEAEMLRYEGKETVREGTFRAGLSLLEAASSYQRPAKNKDLDPDARFTRGGSF